MAAHSFRKFFENKCLEAGIDPFYVSVLMGHKTAGIGVERHYYRPTAINGEYSLLEMYVKKAMPLLTISNEERVRLKNLELEMEMQKHKEIIQKYEKNLESYKSVNERLAMVERILGSSGLPKKETEEKEK